MTRAPAAILDIDGTLVDTNYHHAIAWFRAFRRLDVTLPLYRIHRHIGMGGDQLVAALAGDDFDERHGDEVRSLQGEIYMELIDEVCPLACARELLEELDRRGHAIVLASSAKQHEVDHYLDLLGARELADGWTTSADVERTKPEPDLVAAAIEKAEASAKRQPTSRASAVTSRASAVTSEARQTRQTRQNGPAVMLGDSTWDCKAAARAGVDTVGVLTGGFSEQELREAGAACVFERLEDLLAGLEQTPFASGGRDRRDLA